MKTLLTVASAVLSLACALPATAATQTLFEDDFSADAPNSTPTRTFDGYAIVTKGELINWTIAGGGNVDVAVDANNGQPFPCDGVCIDTDGSSSNALLDMSTKQTFEFLAGVTYTVILDIAEAIATTNGRENETLGMEINGTIVSQEFSTAGEFSFDLTPTTTGTGSLRIFAEGPLDDFGVVLDKVTLTADMAPVPLPAPAALLLGGVAALGALRARRG